MEGSKDCMRFGEERRKREGRGQIRKNESDQRSGSFNEDKEKEE